MYFLCALLHGLNEDDSVLVLRNVYQASSPHKVDVAIMDAVLAEQKESLMLTSCDMQMLMGTEGRERTVKEWTKLCAKAGYSIMQTIDTRSLWKLRLLQST